MLHLIIMEEEQEWGANNLIVFGISEDWKDDAVPFPAFGGEQGKPGAIYFALLPAHPIVFGGYPPCLHPGGPSL